MERFEFVSDLGEGAYGTVWKALDRELNRMVAMKRFKEAHLDEEVMRLAIREIRLLKASSHPNVVQLYEAFKSKSGRVYMVMELVDRSLTEEIRKHPMGFAPDRLKVVSWQLLQATAFLHSNNIIHRDLKPANILLTKDSVVKLCDFGFARTSSSEAAAFTQYVVTRWYRPPEVLVGGPYGTPVDIWAIGCLFSELATGLPLFPGRDTLDQLWLTMRTLGPLPASQMKMLLSDASLSGVKIPAPSELRPLHKRFPEFTTQMMEVLAGCLNPDPAKRLTAQEVLALPYFDDVHLHLEGSSLQGMYDEAYLGAVSNNAPSAASLYSCTSMCAKERAAMKAVAAQEAADAAAAALAACTVGDSPSPARFSRHRISMGASPTSSESRPSCQSPETPVGPAHQRRPSGVHFQADMVAYPVIDARQASDTAKRVSGGAPSGRRPSRDAPMRRQTMDNGLLSPNALMPQGTVADMLGRMAGPTSGEPMFHRISGSAQYVSSNSFKGGRATDGNIMFTMPHAPAGPPPASGHGAGGHAVTMKQRASEGHVLLPGTASRQPKEIKLHFGSMSVGPGGFNLGRAPAAAAATTTTARLAPLPREHVTPRSPQGGGYDPSSKHVRASLTATGQNISKQASAAQDLSRHPSFTMRHQPHPSVTEPNHGHGRSGEQSEPGITVRGEAAESGAPERQSAVSVSLPVIAHLAQVPAPKPVVKTSPGMDGGVMHHTYTTMQRATHRGPSRTLSSLDC